MSILLRTYLKLPKQFVLSHFALIKHFGDKTFQESKYDFLKIIFYCIFTILSVFFSITILVLFWFYQSFCQFILKIWIGENFIELITGCNLLAILEEDQGIISLKLEIQSKKNGNEIFQELQERISEILKTKPIHKKLYSIRQKSMGYFFFEKTEIHLEEILKEIKLEENIANSEELLNREILKICETPLPKNDNFNWDVFLFTTPTQNKENKNGKIFTLIFRIHHTIADGLSIYNIFARLFCCEESEKKIAYSNKLKKQLKNKNKLENFPKLQHYLPNNGIPKNIIFDISAPKKTLLALKTERRNCYVPLIRSVKKKFSVSFVNVLIAAYSASLTDFFIKHSPKIEDVPEEVLTVTPIQMQMERFESNYSDHNHMQIKNDFSVLVFNLPILPKKKKHLATEDYMVERLFMIKKELLEVVSSYDIIFNYMLFKTFLEVLPFNMLKMLLCDLKYTTVATSVPGGLKFHFFNGDLIESAFFFLPKYNSFGLGLSILTYDDKLQIGLTANKGNVTEHEKVTEIINGIFKYLDVLGKEVLKED